MNIVSDNDKRLNEAMVLIDKKATELGLQHSDTVFEIVSQDRMRELSSYIIPIRFHHWTFGRDYYRSRTLDTHGQGGRLYEMVINSRPAYAWLLNSNSLIENKLIVAHVLGHVDFSENNMLYDNTDRRIVNTCAKNAEIISGYNYKYGEDVVEHWIDACLALCWNVSLETFIKESHNWMKQKSDISFERELPKLIEAMDTYGSFFIKEKMKELLLARKEAERPDPILEDDLLLFFIHKAKNLSAWQKDIMAIIREEYRYFRPNIQTKTINEGWSCICGDQFVSTNDGFIKMQELYENKTDHMLYNTYGHVTYTNPHETEEDDIHSITLTNGLTIKGLGRHKVQVLTPVENGENEIETKMLSELAYKTKVLCPIEHDLWANKNKKITYGSLKGKTIDVKIATAIGTLYGFQWKRLGYEYATIRASFPDFKTLEHYTDILNDVFQLAGKISSLQAFNGDYEYIARSYKVRKVFKEYCTEDIPDFILRSKKEIVTAFLTAFFEFKGKMFLDNGIQRFTIRCKFPKLASQVSMLLMNYGIFGSFSKVSDCGKYKNSIVFSKKIQLKKMLKNFRPYYKKRVTEFYTLISKRKNDNRLGNMSAYKTITINNKKWMAFNVKYMQIMDIKDKCYDLTVPFGNTYVAQGILNHNTFWHKKIINELDTECDFLVEDGEDMHFKFNAMHSNVVRPTSKGSLNPYFVGYKIWDYLFKKLQNPDSNFMKNHGLPGPLSEKEAIEQMKIWRKYNSDISFFRNFLDDNLIEELDLFNFRLLDDEWLVTNNESKEVIKNLCSQSTNAGIPKIFIVNDNHNDTGELYLIHDFDGRIMNEESINRVLEHIGKIWMKPVHLETCSRYNDEISVDSNTLQKKLIPGSHLIKVHSYLSPNEKNIEDIPFFERNSKQRAKLEAYNSWKIQKKNHEKMENKIGG